MSASAVCFILLTYFWRGGDDMAEREEEEVTARRRWQTRPRATHVPEL